MLDRELSGHSLWLCADCFLQFRYPRPDIAELNALYRLGNSENWASPASQRTDWKLIREWLVKTDRVTRVLDIGCFDGRLLEYLGSEYEWFGVEINQEAGEVASTRGVRIVGNDFCKLSPLVPPMDVVLAVDVIEHSYDPKLFLRSLASLVRPGGYVIVSTGNAEAFTWKLMGSRYWYCHIAEHMSFLSPKWLRKIAPELKLGIERIDYFSHGGGAPMRRVYEASGNLLLRFAPWVFSLFRKLGMGGMDVRRYPNLSTVPPYWLTAKDHMLAVLKRTL